MKYHLTHLPEDATGRHQESLLSFDEEPAHVGCPAGLQSLDPGQDPVTGEPSEKTAVWRCPDCRQEGMLLHVPDWVARRLQQVADPPSKPPPPTDPRSWQWYLADYFPDGLLYLGAGPAPQHMVRETSVLVLGRDPHVERNEGRTDVAIFDVEGGHARWMPDVVALHQMSPGVILVEGADGHFARLDGHLTAAEKQRIAYLRSLDYFGQPTEAHEPPTT